MVDNKKKAGGKMKLDLEALKKIATGAIDVKEENGAFSFFRFTKEQEELYKITDEGFYRKAKSSAGVKLLFETDSKNLFIKFNTETATTRKYFSVDVFVNGKPLGYVDNFSDVSLERDYTKQDFPLGAFSGEFSLGDGVKKVCVYLPWSVKFTLEEFGLDDGAFVNAVKPTKKLLAFGDSITQGYDALRPQNRYVTRLAEKIGAEEFNKGIGGERFFPELSELSEPFTPDYITVAYGTNDWSGIDSESFKVKCRAFYENLSKNYPDTKIFAITPIWRKDKDEVREFGAFENVGKYMTELLSDISNVKIISGYDLVPEDEAFFADLRLHPNDEGFSYYAENLYRKIKDEL